MEGVILLHGIARTSRTMRPLAKYLKLQGYQVLNLDYPSRRAPIETLAESLQPKIEAFVGPLDRVHFVGHSMGGLVIRAYLHRFSPGNLGRVVMIGTPNHGSEVADALHRQRWFRWYMGPAGQQLVTNLRNREALFGNVNYELGIIACDRTIDPIGSWIIGAPNDGKVSVQSTKLSGMKDHITIPVSHSFAPRRRAVWEKLHRFLTAGSF